MKYTLGHLGKHMKSTAQTQIHSLSVYLSVFISFTCVFIKEEYFWN